MNRILKVVAGGTAAIAVLTGSVVAANADAPAPVSAVVVQPDADKLFAALKAAPDPKAALAKLTQAEADVLFAKYPPTVTAGKTVVKTVPKSAVPGINSASVYGCREGYAPRTLSWYWIDSVGHYFQTAKWCWGYKHKVGGQWKTTGGYVSFPQAEYLGHDKFSVNLSNNTDLRMVSAHKFKLDYGVWHWTKVFCIKMRLKHDGYYRSSDSCYL